MVSISVSHSTVLAAQAGNGELLPATELARACGAGIDWVVQLVEVGIVDCSAPAAQPDEWRFMAGDLQRALEARRLQRDFEVGLDAAALILDLEREVRRLKSVLHAQGLSPR